MLPSLVQAFLAAYLDILLDAVVGEGFVDILAAGCDAGHRYGERKAQDLIANSLGPRRHRMATTAAPAYLKARGHPMHARDLVNHACLRG